jgi:hypothetical protein
MSSYEKIDFDHLLYENRFGPNMIPLRGIVCPFCGWKKDLEIPGYQPDENRNLAREAMSLHWDVCEKFPSELR